MNPDYARLRTAMRASLSVLKPFREKRLSMVRQYRGGHWGEPDGTPPDPVNLLSIYAQIVGRNLISNNPRVQLSTFHRASKPDVAIMQEWVNQRIEKLHLADVFRRNVLDALFCMGIAKVGIATPADAAQWQWGVEAGQPFLAGVDLEDFVYDVAARDFNEASFIGHRYRSPIDVVKDAKYFTKARKDLQPSRADDFNYDGDQKIASIGRRPISSDEQFEDYVDLWEIYLPRYRMLVTLADDFNVEEPLREQKWIGPECGPYPSILGFQVVPGSAIPKAPMMDLVDTNDALNRAWRKLIRQADRIKTGTFVQGVASEDGSVVLEFSDGDVVKVDNPQSIKEQTTGGPHPGLHAFAMEVKNTVSWLAGNLDIMGGLSPQSKTATQDKLLNENSSAGIADKQDATLTHVSKCMAAMCWYWWEHPTQEMQVEYAIPGMSDISITRNSGPEQRQRISWDKVNCKVEPYSIRMQSPQQRAEAIVGVIERLYIPLAQLAQQQGITLDLNALFVKLGVYLDQPDLQEVLSIMEPPREEEAEGGEAPGMPAKTTRSYERINRSEATKTGQDGQVMQALLGKNPGGANGKPQASGSYS